MAKRNKSNIQVHKTTFFTQYTIQTENLFFVFVNAQKQVFWIREVFKIIKILISMAEMGDRRLKQCVKMVITRELINGLY